MAADLRLEALMADWRVGGTGQVIKVAALWLPCSTERGWWGENRLRGLNPAVGDDGTKQSQNCELLPLSNTHRAQRGN